LIRNLFPAIILISPWETNIIAVTHIPDAPDHIKGVINLRGTIVPVMDLRIKLGMEHVTYNPSTVMIVFNFNQRVLALVVDSVSDVITLASSELRAPPEFGSDMDSRCILGIGTVDERMLIVLNIQSLMNDIALDNHSVATSGCTV